VILFYADVNRAACFGQPFGGTRPRPSARRKVEWMMIEPRIDSNAYPVAQMIEFGGDNSGHDIVRNEAFRRNQI
jgi:hypothetical protein